MAANTTSSAIVIVVAIIVPIAIAGVAVVLFMAYRRRARRSPLLPQVRVDAPSDHVSEDTALPPPIHIKNTRKPRHQTILDWPSPQELNFPRTPNGGFAHFNVAYRSPPPLTATHSIPPTPDNVALSPTDTARFSIMNAPPSSPPGLSTYATFAGAAAAAAASSRTLVLVNGDLSRASSALPMSRQDDEERRARSVDPVDVNLVHMRSGRLSVVGSPQAIGH